MTDELLISPSQQSLLDLYAVYQVDNHLEPNAFVIKIPHRIIFPLCILYLIHLQLCRSFPCLIINPHVNCMPSCPLVMLRNSLLKCVLLSPRDYHITPHLSNLYVSPHILEPIEIFLFTESSLWEISAQPILIKLYDCPRKK